MARLVERNLLYIFGRRATKFLPNQKTQHNSHCHPHQYPHDTLTCTLDWWPSAAVCGAMRLHDSEEALALVVSAVARDWADGGDWAFAAGGAGAICSNGFNQTVFHAPTPPATDIATYVGRIIAYAGASRVVYVAALAYIARAIAGPFGDILQLTSFNIHRMMFAACLIATKYFDDQ